MRPLDEARRDVLAAMEANPVVRVSLRQSLGLVLGEDVVAGHDLPPFPNSSMDGYAVRAADVAETPVDLTVVDDLRAGYESGAEVRPGTAIQIMTGAPVPAGADAIVPVEQVEHGSGTVRILEGVAPGRFVRAAGGDVAGGTTVVSAGDRLSPAHLGVLAALGVTEVPVRRRPVVAFMSTGDEVVPPETKDLAPGKIRDANRPLLSGLLAELGAESIDLGIVPDDAAALRSALSDGADRADVVVTTGGVSMGTHDLVKQVLAEQGTVDFWKVAMQPAKPFAFGWVGKTPLFGLPGNPVSSMVAFEQFLRPALLTMMGSAAILRPRVRGTSSEDLSTDPAKTVFVRARSEYGDGRWVATPSKRQQSNMLSAVANGNCFIVVPEGIGDVASGREVELEMFQWPATRMAP